MRLLLLHILLTLVIVCNAQDKIFLRNGTSQKGVVLSMATDFVLFKLSDTSAATYKIPRADILMVEKMNGKVFIFGDGKKKDTSTVVGQIFPKHYIGLHPFSFMVGRATLAYEHLNKKGDIGVVIPFSLSFDPVGVIYEPTDSTIRRNPGVNFIGGVDLNFYLGKEKHFFVGPRLRYGTDMLLENIEAYSIQTQFGWRKQLWVKGLYQHFSLGIGFARILSSQAGNRISPKQSYGWGSVNYRLSFGW